MRRILLLMVMLTLAGGSQAALTDRPVHSLLWNNFTTVTMLDGNVAAATTPLGLVLLELNPTTGQFDVIADLLLNTEPAEVKLTDGILAVSSYADMVYFVEITPQATLRLLGEIDLGFGIYDLALQGQRLFLAAGFGGLLSFELTNYADPVLVETRLEIIHAVQVEAIGNDLYVLDDYNGLARFDLMGSNLGAPLDLLGVPRRAGSFAWWANEVAFSILDRPQIYLGSYAGTQPAVVDSIALVGTAQAILVADTFLVAVDADHGLLEVVNRNGTSHMYATLDKTYTVDNSGDTYNFKGSPSLLLPLPGNSLISYNLANLWFDSSPSQAYARPGPITSLEFTGPRLATAGDGNPLDLYRLGANQQPFLDTTVLGLNTARSVATSGDIVFALYPELDRIMAMDVSADSINLVSSVAVNGRAIKEIMYYDLPLSDTLDMLFAVGVRGIDVFSVGRDKHLEHAAIIRTLNAILDVVVVDSFVVISTTERQIEVFRMFNSLSFYLWWSIATPVPFNHLAVTGTRMNDQQWFFRSLTLCFDGPDMYELYIREQGLPITSFVGTLPIPVTASALAGNDMYTIGPLGVGRIDLGLEVPVMIDYGGFGGHLMAANETALAASDGTAVHLYQLDDDLPVITSAPTADDLPKAHQLSNHPNPFNPRTTISYHLDAASPVDLSVYDILGRRVTRLVDRRQEAGNHTVAWDGLDQQGQRVASGVYFYRLHTEAASQTRKMILLK